MEAYTVLNAYRNLLSVKKVNKKFHVILIRISRLDQGEHQVSRYLNYHPNGGWSSRVAKTEKLLNTQDEIVQKQ